MKSTSFATALFAIGASAYSKPTVPVAGPAVNVTTSDATLLIYAENNATQTVPEVKVLVSGPGINVTTFNASDIADIAVTVLEAIDLVDEEPAPRAQAVARRHADTTTTTTTTTTQAKNATDVTPSLSLWIEDAAEGQTAPLYNITISGAQVQTNNITQEAFVDLALALLIFGEAVENGTAITEAPASARA